MGEFSYLTVENNASGLYKEKGSKFIAYVFSVHSEEEVKSNLEQLRKKHHDARHHCFAWVLGADKSNTERQMMESRIILQETLF